MYFIGLDVHKKTISYWVKDAAGRVHQEGKIGSTRRELDCWIRTMPQPRMIAMEATIFTGWIYDHLLPCREGEGCAPSDAAGDRRGQEEESRSRPYAWHSTGPLRPDGTDGQSTTECEDLRTDAGHFELHTKAGEMATLVCEFMKTQQ
jgi:hypothetical protein